MQELYEVRTWWHFIHLFSEEARNFFIHLRGNQFTISDLYKGQTTNSADSLPRLLQQTCSSPDPATIRTEWQSKRQYLPNSITYTVPVSWTMKRMLDNLFAVYSSTFRIRTDLSSGKSLAFLFLPASSCLRPNKLLSNSLGDRCLQCDCSTTGCDEWPMIVLLPSMSKTVSF